jgi:hypothetical protein
MLAGHLIQRGVQLSGLKGLSGFDPLPAIPPAGGLVFEEILPCLV